MLLRFIDGISYGLRFDNANLTHLVPASGKLVLHKIADDLVGFVVDFLLSSPN